MKTAALALSSALLAVSLTAADGAPAPAPGARKPVPESADASARAWLGVVLGEVDEPLAYHLSLQNDLGVLVTAVEPGSPAEAMGIRQWDVIVACDGQPMYTPRAFSALVQGHQPGESVEVAVRRGPATETVGGRLGKAPPRPEAASGEEFDALRQRMEEHLRRLRDRQGGRRGGTDEGAIPVNPTPAPGQTGKRSGRIENADGTTLEWSIEGAGGKQGSY